MPVMNKDEFMKEFARYAAREKKLDLPRSILDERPEFLFALYEATHCRQTVEELNKTYIILTRLLLGKYPEIAAVVPSKDRIRLPYVAIEYLPPAKGKFTSQEKLIFAFSVFHSICIEVYDEETGQIHKGITELKSAQKIMDLMLDDMNAHPERYKFLASLDKSRRKVSSAPFGTSRDNPVKAISIPAGYSYLGSLRTLECRPVEYRRTGSMSGGDGGIIDAYTLTFTEAGIQKSITVYIDPYAGENSSQAPEGLMIAENEDEGSDEELAALLALAKDGDGSAQFKLGLMYYHGEGVEQDYSEAFKWYSKAAEQGYAGAQTNLGLMYSEGKGTAQDYVQAVKWYKLAADKGFAEALHDLGFMYYTGHGVSQDFRKAINLWLKAAVKGNTASQNNLGYAYRTGTGVAQDYAEALRWYKLAAEKGCAEALGDLGIMYEKGQGVAVDVPEAVKFYRSAADKGSEEARDALRRLGKL